MLSGVHGKMVQGFGEILFKGYIIVKCEEYIKKFIACNSDDSLW